MADETKTIYLLNQQEKLGIGFLGALGSLMLGEGVVPILFALLFFYFAERCANAENKTIRVTMVTICSILTGFMIGFLVASATGVVSHHFVTTAIVAGVMIKLLLDKAKKRFEQGAV